MQTNQEKLELISSALQFMSQLSKSFNDSDLIYQVEVNFDSPNDKVSDLINELDSHSATVSAALLRYQKTLSDIHAELLQLEITELTAQAMRTNQPN